MSTATPATTAKDVVFPTRDDPSRPPVGGKSLLDGCAPLQLVLEFFEMRGPMFELREGCDPKRYRDAPILHFGFGINEEQIYRFALNRGMIKREDYMSDRVAAASSLLPVKRHLEKVANARLHFRIPVSYEFELMFALYSNYSIEDEQYEDEHEQEVLRIIQSELGIEQQPPLWYWDRSNNG